MRVVADLVAAQVERWTAASVERAVFGTTDPVAIADCLAGFTETMWGSPVHEGLFYRSSAGCVLGVELRDGRRVVIKAYQQRWGHDFLDAVRRVQEHLVVAGFPCPRPIAGPERLGEALATVEGFVHDPGVRMFRTEEEMAMSAGGLAQQVRLCRGVHAPSLGYEHPLRAPAGGLYPQPHHPLFDFSARPEGARWIDDLAAAAKVIRDRHDDEPVVGHTDWSARNVRLDDRGLVVAYDWDSLAVVPEAVAVGQAAATWRSTGEAEDPIAPGLDEVQAYLAAYEMASGHRLTAGQQRAALAAALWVLAYSARCEYALEVVTGERAERARGRLAIDGTAFLDDQ